MPTVSSINELRDIVRARLGERRFAHTLAVEKEIIKLGKRYLPRNICRLQIAALLHDVTKELSTEEHIALCERYGVPLTNAEQMSPKTLHAKTGALLAADEFADLVDEEIVEAIAKHTTGARDMSLFAKLLYLADYIEETRTFPDCIRLRKIFWDDFDDLPRNKRGERLDRVLLASFQLTIDALLAEGAVIAPETIEARDAILADINKYN
ncbi:MAG: bis(5'-nucleosyl)-tetraphosphatase (symmetrical) YqeK [Clostridia bacterium]|nr:bis(5'-nucleosyl)-tetraphosphatase (symmetrical) YqeK [Clostridia bacterium]